MYTLIFTTNPGIEDIAAEEIAAKLNASIVSADKLRGRVIAKVAEDKLYRVDLLRSIHRARILLGETSVCRERACLEHIREFIETLPLSEYITPRVSFAVRAERVGEHEYTSLDIARVAGDAVINLVRSVYGERPPVDLDHPHVIIAVDVMFDKLYVSIELGGDLSWHRRGYRVYEHPASLKPTLAYAMLIISGVRDSEVVMDPMCGGGTIPIEALLFLEDARAICSDFNPLHIRGAKMNAMAARVYKRMKFYVHDARRISEVVKSVDRIVLNPPYGIRLGNPRDIRALYTDFLREISRLDFRRLVMITTEHVHVKNVAERIGLKIVHERVVAHGNLWPKILALEH
ncbi:rRNA (guanine-N(2)-)-methyltransferase [Pyrolobus fumarii 1A]|uniref:rRNA (Guanine-N(2)-)-methyltransferase n=1 Tax=Pyrolobus fumarii (strain DSM 11204 / 1A) TaxID=694429 RepID=G0EET0_PYRF1|nr:THUMP domain-containing protein [Pyrolobus fumarii]AEM38044.1 rRNA (guanine-N(2)-)-methyltransferase [Pyrolobus fumarii 1A]